MPCYHPLVALPNGKHTSGKTKYEIVSYHDGYFDDPDYRTHIFFQRGGYPVQIPCGQCIGCRLDHSRQWANRCMLELEYHDSAFFLTLTYDDAHVPKTYYADPTTGEALPALTLQKRDLQLFMKRLRKAFPDDKIRFYACGEYGTETLRPHYHVIAFGLHLDDLKVYKKSKEGFTYFNSDKLQRCWSIYDPGNDLAPLQPIGYAVAADVTWETCAYVARYITKKLKGPAAEYYDFFNLTPPFTNMSLKPGIARQWYEDHPDLMDYEYINLSTEKGGLKFKPPKYYNRLFDLDCPEKSVELKESRKNMAKAAKAAKLSGTNLSYLELLEVEENNKIAKTKSLERKL